MIHSTTKTPTRISLFLLLSTLMVAVPSFADQHAAALSDKEAILAHGQRWKQLYEAGQIDNMHALYEPDAWLMTHGAPAAMGVEAILTYLKRSKVAGNKAIFEFTPEDITIRDSQAYLISKYWMTITKPDGEEIQAMGRSFLVFIKGEDGIWRLWRDMDNQAPDVLWDEKPNG